MPLVNALRLKLRFVSFLYLRVPLGDILLEIDFLIYTLFVAFVRRDLLSERLRRLLTPSWAASSSASAGMIIVPSSLSSSDTPSIT